MKPESPGQPWVVYSGLSITPVYPDRRNTIIGATQSSWLHNFPLHRGVSLAGRATCPGNSRTTHLSILTCRNINYIDAGSFRRHAHRRRTDSIFFFWSCNSSLNEIECRCRSTRSRLSAIDVLVLKGRSASSICSNDRTDVMPPSVIRDRGY